MCVMCTSTSLSHLRSLMYTLHPNYNKSNQIEAIGDVNDVLPQDVIIYECIVAAIFYCT